MQHGALWGGGGGAGGGDCVVGEARAHCGSVAGRVLLPAGPCRIRPTRLACPLLVHFRIRGCVAGVGASFSSVLRSSSGCSLDDFHPNDVLIRIVRVYAKVLLFTMVVPIWPK